jgi:hypothetical protein
MARMDEERECFYESLVETTTYKRQRGKKVRLERNRYIKGIGRHSQATIH